MKLLSILATAIFAASIFASPAAEQEAQAGCALTGTYTNSNGLSSCASVLISSLNVPAGVTLDLTSLKPGVTVTFTGTTTFGTKLWEGPLVLLTGTNLKVTGPGTLDGQGAWYWKQVDLDGIALKNSPFRTFSILNSANTQLTRLTLDSSAGDGLAKNTDGFDLSRNNGVSITHNTIHNQDDCLAMQSSTNTTFSDNSCTGGHGISIGSIGGAAADASDTVQGLTVSNNKIINNVIGLRIKTIVDLKGLVSGVTYTNNVLTNVQNAIVMHSDYSKSKGGYTGSATSQVGIKGITISGLSGTATNLYDVVANPSAVSNWKWPGITVQAKNKGSCKGQPSGVTCA
ncbi:Polygalacturonase 1 [Aphanomyces cochlioides]|nr:Polygalacturonase 1 [Aphanomyces cochlioides]